MSNELEIAAGASAGSLFRPRQAKHAPPPGTPCANCATPLQGAWCHACGQHCEDYHRSVGHLATEALEGLIHLDGRLWRTLPDLMLHPARLTRAFIDGHRAPQIPPLRLFLVILLGVFVIGGLTGKANLVHINRGPQVGSTGRTATVIGPGDYDQLSPEERAKVQSALSKVTVRIGDRPNLAASNWLQERLTRTLADPERFQLVLEQWSERFAILMLPVSALLLSALFAFQRRFFFFDHTIFSLHSLSAMGVVLIVSMLLSTVADGWAFLLLIPAPIHLFAHMRGVYRTGVLGTLVRMVLLFIGSSFAAGLLVVGLIGVGLNGMGG